MSFNDIFKSSFLENVSEFSCRCYNDVRQEEKRIANRSGL